MLRRSDSRSPFSPLAAAAGEEEEEATVQAYPLASSSSSPSGRLPDLPAHVTLPQWLHLSVLACFVGGSFYWFQNFFAQETVSDHARI